MRKSKHYCSSCIYWQVDTTICWESTHHPYFAVKAEGVCAKIEKRKLNCQRACRYFEENYKSGKFIELDYERN